MKLGIKSKLQNLRRFITKYKILSVVVCLVLVVLITFAGVRQYSGYYYASKVSFQEYVPSWLPQGVQIVSRSVNVDHDARLGATDVAFSLNLNHPSLSYVQEDQVAHRYDSCGYYANGGQSCESIITPHGQQYMLLTNNDVPVNVQDQGIELYKGNVNIYMRFQDYPGQPYSRATLDRLIDSFMPVHYHRLLGTTSESCGCGG